MHYHGYIQRPMGQGDPPSDWDDRHRAPWGVYWDTSPWMPSMIPWLLYKPASFIKHTSDTPDDAVAWAESLYRPAWGPDGTDPSKHGLTVDQYLAGAHDDLTRGSEAVLQGPRGVDYFEIWLLSCPSRAVVTPPCPIGRRDTRPEGMGRITGIPGREGRWAHLAHEA